MESGEVYNSTAVLERCSCCENHASLSHFTESSCLNARDSRFSVPVHCDFFNSILPSKWYSCGVPGVKQFRLQICVIHARLFLTIENHSVWSKHTYGNRNFCIDYVLLLLYPWYKGQTLMDSLEILNFIMTILWQYENAAEVHE